MPRMGRVPNENRGRNQKPVPVILMEDEMRSNKGYQGRSRNCSTFAREGVKKATAHRIGVLKEAEKRELDITSKAADYIQQQTNGNASDWIIN